MNDRPSYPWSEGDALFAAELNAAIANMGVPLDGSPVTFTGPLIYTATGGTTPRSAQDRSADVVNVLDWGAICDGVANDTAAFTLAFNYAVASGGKTVVIPAGKCCYLPNGITVPSGVTLEGLSYYANPPRMPGSTTVISPPSSSILTNANINSVRLGTGGNLQAVALRNLVIATNASVAPTAGAGVYVNTGHQVHCESVMVYNAYDGFYWKTSGSAGIYGTMDLCNTDMISGHHVVMDTWAELRLNLCRFSGTYGAAAYVYMTGGGPAGQILPNGYFATNCQYNENGPTVGALLSVGGLVSTAAAASQEYHFVNCHAEHYNYTVRTDATVTTLQKVRFVGCTLFAQGFAGSSDFFNINPATAQIFQVILIGNEIAAPSMTVPVGFQECEFVGNSIYLRDKSAVWGTVTLTGASGGTMCFQANGVVGHITLAGAWGGTGGLLVDATMRSGFTLTNTATGNVRVSVPGYALRMTGLPTSSAGLAAGDIWRNGTVLNIV